MTSNNNGDMAKWVNAVVLNATDRDGLGGSIPLIPTKIQEGWQSGNAADC